MAKKKNQIRSMLWVNDISFNEADLPGFSIPPTFPESVHHHLSKKLQATSAKKVAEDFNTLPKFDSSPLKNGAWKTILSYWVFGDFSGGRTVKLWEGTLQGTNISPQNGILKMIFLVPRWDMLIPWRVNCISGGFFWMKSDFLSSTFWRSWTLSLGVGYRS